MLHNCAYTIVQESCFQCFAFFLVFLSLQYQLCKIEHYYYCILGLAVSVIRASPLHRQFVRLRLYFLFRAVAPFTHLPRVRLRLFFFIYKIADFFAKNPLFYFGFVLCGFLSRQQVGSSIFLEGFNHSALQLLLSHTRKIFHKCWFFLFPHEVSHLR